MLTSLSPPLLLAGLEGGRQRPDRSPLRLPAGVRLRGQRLHRRLPQLPALVLELRRPGLRLPWRLGASLPQAGRPVRRRGRLAPRSPVDHKSPTPLPTLPHPRSKAQVCVGGNRGRTANMGFWISTSCITTGQLFQRPASSGGH